MKRFIIEELTMQQDYLWFLACLGLLAAGMMALRPVPGRRAQPWAAWVLFGYLGMAVAELARLAQIVRPPELGPPNLELDLLHGGFLALQVFGIWQPAGRRAFGAVLLAELLVAAALRHYYPWSATIALSLAATVGLVWRARREADPEERRLAWSLLPGLWFSPIGPVTSALGCWLVQRWSALLLAGAPREEGITPFTVGLRRWETAGPWGVWAAAVLIITGGCVVWTLTRRNWTERERLELRRFLPWTAVWLVAGLALAAGLGWRMRREYESAQKMQANLAAKLLSPAALARAFGPDFDPVWEDTNRGIKRARLNRKVQEAFLPVRQQLATIQAELPDDSYALLMLERNGYRTVAAVASTFVNRSDVIVAQNPEPDFVPARPETRFLPPYQDSYGIVTQARAPLYFPDGRFLGWLALESGPGEWLARQTQARVLALTAVGLGLGLALLALRQRLRNLARDEALREAEVARQANQAKSQFLARVSHELRTPIQSVLGNSELLRSALPDGTARARLDALRQHGHLMARLVEDLLDLGAMQTGRFHLAPRPTQVIELVHQTLESMRPQAEAKGLDYHVMITGDPGRWWQADGERIRQVVLNLAGNAIKFTDAGAVDISFGPDGRDGLVLRVGDTGPGVAPGDAARLFQPFARLEGTSTKEGTGLGLVMAKGIAESMGGGIVLEPRQRGACFVATFHLPPAAAPNPAIRPPAGSLCDRSILVVDDNTLIRELFSGYFRELGAACDIAADGNAALQLVDTRRYDAVVLDMALPGMNGAEVARRLRRRNLPGLRIVGVSAHAAPEDRTQALAAGMDSFLTKPVDLRTLVEEVAGVSPAQPPPAMTPELAGLQERLRAQFQAEAPALAAALDQALAGEDWAGVQAKAHYLKNSADVLGLRNLGEACRDLELAASRRHPPAIAAAAENCRLCLSAWH